MLAKYLHLPSQDECNKENKKIKDNFLERGEVIEVQVEVSDFFEHGVNGGEVRGECYHGQRVAVNGVGGVRGTDSTGVFI